MADPFSSAYANETYLQSLAASKADADRALQNALSEISRQRQVGQEAAGRISGAANEAFDTGQSRLSGDLQSLGLAGLSKAAGQAFDLSRLGYSNAGQLLQEGFNEQGVQRSGGARNIVSSVIADITGRGNEYVSKREQEDREREYREAEAARQRALQEELARRAREMQQRALAAQAAEAERQRQFMASQAPQRQATASQNPMAYGLASIAALAMLQQQQQKQKPGPRPAGAGTSADFRTKRIL